MLYVVVSHNSSGKSQTFEVMQKKLIIKGDGG